MTFFDVVGFGAINLDKLFKVNLIAAAEEETFVTDFTEAPGGSAANTIVGLARLECKTGFIGKVAADVEGEKLVEAFRREDVDTGGVIRSLEGRSGVVLGFVDPEGQRALYIDSGVNDTLDFSEIDKKYAAHTRFLHLTSFVGDEPFQAQKNLLERMPQELRLSFDPGALYARLGADRLEPFIKKTHVAMPNSGELALLTGKTDYCKGAEYMLERGVKVVAVKLGEKGCYVTDGKETHLVKPFKVKVVDTTGAGDAFCAGFLYGLVNDRSLFDCGRIGNFVASRCIMHMGARTGLPTLAELKKNRLA
jgi:ribokinase